jgi:hypothetical protein
MRVDRPPVIDGFAASASLEAKTICEKEGALKYKMPAVHEDIASIKMFLPAVLFRKSMVRDSESAP